jgi:ATP-dependent Clp protease protease subunit
MTKHLQQFDVRCEGTAVELTLYGHIGPSLFGDEEGLTAQRVMDVLAANKSATQITLNINSPGGLMFEALAMYNALRRHPARKVVNIDGYAASAASLLAMVGDQINIAANGMMMIHDPINLVLGNAEEMRRAAEDLDKQAGPAVTTYAARTKNSPDQIRAWMRNTTWFTADECKTHKFADEITPAKSVAACDLSAYRYAKLPQQESAAVAVPDKRCPDAGAPQMESTMPEDKASAADKTIAAAAAASDGVREECIGLTSPMSGVQSMTEHEASNPTVVRLMEQMDATPFMVEVRRLMTTGLNQEAAMSAAAHQPGGNERYLEWRELRLQKTRAMHYPPTTPARWQ